ncbi:MAG: hypothetical protein PUG70_04125 [Lachnospiraceae bacterium]|nr:hypothetical protein [Lachnospiraceae bacterium]
MGKRKRLVSLRVGKGRWLKGRYNGVFSMGKRKRLVSLRVGKGRWLKGRYNGAFSVGKEKGRGWYLIE